MENKAGKVETKNAETRKVEIRGLEGFEAKKRNITMLSGTASLQDINVSLASVQSALDELSHTLNSLFKSDISLDYGDDGTIKINISGTAERAVQNEYGEPIDTTYQRRDEMYFDKGAGTLYWREKK